MKLIQALKIVEDRIEELTSMIRQGEGCSSSNALTEFISRNDVVKNKELLKINLRIYKAMNGRPYGK